MAISAIFSAAQGILSIFGDSLDNTVTVSRDAAGTILINGGAVTIFGGTPTVANTTLLQGFGLAGNDQVILNEANGALPKVNLFGAIDNDVLAGSSGADQLFGEDGNDTLLGQGGNDLLFGGDGNDVLTGGDADDQMFGQAGNDRLIWDPGDDTDLFEGGDGIDTAEVNGGNGAEAFTVNANGTRVRFDRVNPAPFSIDIGTTESLVINANGGDDTITAGNGLAALISIVADGGAGNDTILSGDGTDVLFGGDGNDIIDGNRGNDVGFLGAGDDVFIWDPGDGNDVIEGQSGLDTMQFNGNAANENIDISANGERVRFFRDIAAVVMDLDDVERINFEALGGTDNIIVNDLSGTDTQQINLNLAGALGGAAGDAQVDTVVLNGTNGANAIDVLGQNGNINVSGLPALISLQKVEGIDRLVINGNGDNDTISAATLVTPVNLTIDGGAGNDILIGSNLADVFLGGDGNDFVDGRRGDDVAFLGTGNDVFLWNPGDGNDTIEGQAGIDEMLFNGNAANETIDISANGGRARFFRDVANVAMDTNDVERITFNAFDGRDTININDLSGTDVNLIRLDVSGGPNVPLETSSDQVTVNSTVGNDTIAIATVNGEIVISGLSAQVQIAGIRAGFDNLTINGLAGNDVIDASKLAANLFQQRFPDGRLTLDGGDGTDLFVGSAGEDVFLGGRGNDVALMGAGDDLFVWNPGDDNDVLEGQAGFDTMFFNGANVNENIDIAANGSRIRFFRDVANVTMDLNNVENTLFRALGGADNIVVNDLSGTDAKQVNIDLAGLINGETGDGQTDIITIQGTNAQDLILISSVGSFVNVTGLSAVTRIRQADNDVLVINGNAGDDAIDASSLTTTTLRLTLNGDNGNDTIWGAAGNDSLNGGAGHDLLIGGLGTDTLSGGNGTDRYRFNNLKEGGDILANFGANDFIQLRASNFGGGLVAGQAISNNQFRVGDAAQDANDRLIFNGSTRSLYFDADGLGGAGQTLVATLSANVPTNIGVSATNIQVI
ncbi:calcium-binding protein [Phormidium sp. FACHB-592]|uniref:Calcium-binding protein n=1 Tax=Stenomitos frigidus AS-A4 TaxID=2933935 RepID=A0ABV0KT58_9CYAN|nr:calcium-binding protein [Phormidium sp. FACHB-592]MBD2073320.1 calcium-binding protein [Phormidium sp. FACHB-592]